jgi:uncharacterized coiled-coil DUF342 family protein
MNNEHACLKADTIESLVKKVDNLDGLREVITEIKTLMSVQVDLNKKTDERLEKYDDNMQKHSEALVLVTTTMDRQNKSLDKLNEKMDKTKEDLNKKIDEINKKVDIHKIEYIQKTSWDFLDFIKTKGVPFLIGGGIIYGILQVI